MNIHFEKAQDKHKDLIFQWLAEPHMMQYWDNSQEHKDDILNFMSGRQEPSNYFNGIFLYWVGFVDDQPFSFILSSTYNKEQEDISDLHRAYLSKTGHTVGLDFGIGNPEFLGVGLAAPTLRAFVDFYHSQIDLQADTFFIDPNTDNPRAIHVYSKADFQLVGDFKSKEGTFFEGKQSYLMVRSL